MKRKLGIIGGMGSRAAVNFVDMLVEHCKAKRDQDFVEYILHNNSAVPDRTQAILYQGASPVPELKRSVAILNGGSVDVIVLACITSYNYLDDFKDLTTAKFLNPIGIVREHIERYHPKIKKVGLLATSGTIRSQLFAKGFEGSSIELIVLNESDQEDLFMQSIYMEDGLKSSFASANASRMLLECANNLALNGAELIIGGCSEVSLELSAEMIDVPFVDSMKLTALEAVRCCLNY